MSIVANRFVVQTGSMKDEVSNYLARPKRYDNIDGTGEMFMGLMMLGFALMGYLERVIPHDSFWTQHEVFFMYAVLAVVFALGFALQQVIKRNITFPRTGYVARGSAERPVATKMKAWIYAAVVGAGVALVVEAVMFVLVPSVLHGKNHSLNLAVARLFYAGLFVAIYGFWITRMGQGQQWKWAILVLMAAALLAAGILIPAQQPFKPFWHDEPFSWWVMILSGTSWFASGAGTLIMYLHQHQVAPSES